jgi:hypothetical protein
LPFVSIGVGEGVRGVAVVLREGVVKVLLLLVSVDACTLACTLVQSTFFGCKFTLFRFKKGLGVGAFGEGPEGSKSPFDRASEESVSVVRVPGV